MKEERAEIFNKFIQWYGRGQHKKLFSGPVNARHYTIYW